MRRPFVQPLVPPAVSAALLLAAWASALSSAPRVQVLPHPVAPRVDIVMDEAPFASYAYLTAMPRPALIALRAPGAVLVDGTEETADGNDPAGFWFAHGSVNGLDFTSAPAPNRGRGPRIVHRRVVEATSSDTLGRLAVQSAWIGTDQSVVLLEDTFFAFSETAGHRTIDRVTRLAAINGPVHLGSATGGLAGVRVAGGLAERASSVGSAAGAPMPSGCAATRGRWLAVPIVREGRTTAAALFDHPGNPGHPNALRCGPRGLEVVSSAVASIAAGASVTFRYRLVLAAGAPDAAALETAFAAWSR